MIQKRKPQSNFICNPDGPWGPVYDSALQNERFVINYRFVEYRPELVDEDEEAFNTIRRLRQIFTQFKDKAN